MADTEHVNNNKEVNVNHIYFFVQDTLVSMTSWNCNENDADDVAADRRICGVDLVSDEDLTATLQHLQRRRFCIVR